MSTTMPFVNEVSNLLYAATGNSIHTCMQCGFCSSNCPVVEFMDHSPRRLIAMVRADLKDEVMSSTGFWTCSSCYQCTVRCPRGIDIAEIMYGLKRYSIWKHTFSEDLIGPDFSMQFVTMILKTGRSFEPGLAPAFLFKMGVGGFLEDAKNTLKFLSRRRLPLFPTKIKRLKQFQRMLGKIVPMKGTV